MTVQRTGSLGPDGSPASTLAAVKTPLGWTIDPPTVTTRPREGVSLTLRQGDCAEVLTWLAQRWARYVEPLDGRYCGGYNHRANVNSPGVWSEHAAGVAIDLNWHLHPNGRAPSPTLVVKVTAALAAAERYGVVRWGGEYHHTKDPMHVELLHKPDAIHALAAKLRADRAK